MILNFRPLADTFVFIGKPSGKVCSWPKNSSEKMYNKKFSCFKFLPNFILFLHTKNSTSFHSVQYITSLFMLHNGTNKKFWRRGFLLCDVCIWEINRFLFRGSATKEFSLSVVFVGRRFRFHREKRKKKPFPVLAFSSRLQRQQFYN